MNKIRTRFAPSPTGYLHIGGLRTALFAFLFARKHNGTFVLRIEDTDQARFVEGSIEKMIQTLHTVGLDYDEGVVIENGKLIDKGDLGPYLQSRRKDLYKKHAQELVDKKQAYYCFCDEKRLEDLRKEQIALKKAPMYDRKCRNLSQEEIKAKIDSGEQFAIRQAIPESGQTTVTDLVYGQITYDNKTLDDQVLLKSDGFPTYHLAAVVDDHLMQISHVIRGEEWLPSAPKHILLYKSFGWDAPEFAHLPLLLNKDRSKLSKRQGDVAVEDYLAKGYLREALINFVAFLGWNPKTEQEVFTLDQLIKDFDLTKINKSSAIFDIEKLDWLNGLYIRNTDSSKLAEMVLPYIKDRGYVTEVSPEKFKTKNGKPVDIKYIEAVINVEKERLKKLSEIGERVGYFFDHPNYSPEILIWKKSNLADTKAGLKLALDLLQGLDDSEFGSAQDLETKFKGEISAKKMSNGTVLWPLRVSLSGMEASPGPFEIMSVLHIGFGKFEILHRVESALKSLE